MYAKYMLARIPGHVQFAVRDAFGRLCLFEHAAAVEFVSAIDALWRDGAASRRARWRMAWRFHCLHAGFLLRGARALRRRIEAARGQTIYIVVSHLRLDRPRFLARMQRSGRVRLVFFVHDIIPSQFPELCPPGEPARDRAVMRGAARLADAILANSAATRRDFLEIYGSDGLAARTYVAPLGCAPFASPAAPATPAQPYFVVLGRIVPRKNHLLLLTIWRRLGPEAPRLVIVGARMPGIENVIDLLERSTALRGTVEERSRVPDAELGPLLVGARALLFPSLAEGYGMPLAEALAAGVPVLCSDLPPFREVGADVPEYLDPLDGPSLAEGDPRLCVRPVAAPRGATRAAEALARTDLGGAFRRARDRARRACPMTMPDRIMLDMTRLVCAAWDRAPTGIPRVELAYAKYLLARAPAEVQFTVRDAMSRICLVERQAAADFVGALEAYWRGGVGSRWSYRRLGLRAHRLHAGLLLRGVAPLRRAIAESGGRTIYIVVSQYHLDLPYVLDFVRRWGELRLVYFVHDVLPSQFPEYFLPDAAANNRTRMRDAARLADAIITNSAATQRDFLDLYGTPGLDGRIYVAPLGAARLAPPALPAAGVGGATGAALFRHSRHDRAAQEPPAAAQSLAPVRARCAAPRRRRRARLGERERDCIS